jgi:cytoskeleton protein RodZ
MTRLLVACFGFPLPICQVEPSKLPGSIIHLGHRFEHGGEKIVVQELTYYPKGSETTAETVRAALRSRMRQVEAELHHSSTYERVVSNLQTLPTEMGQQLQRMINAIGREAIRLAFREWTENTPKPDLEPVSATMPPPSPRPTPVPVPDPAPDRSEAETRSLSSLRPALIGTAYNPRNQPRRLSKKEQSAQAALHAWETQLQSIGAQVRRVRQNQHQSPYQLHLKTQVPIHQIEALETGRIDRLPEDIYIRGFLRRIGDALNMDGVALAASLPPVDPVKAILPTWYHPSGTAGAHLRPVHLYVGYAALLAGGFTWLMHQSVLQSPTNSVPPPAQAPTSPQRHSTHRAEVAPPIAAVSAPERLLC